MKRTRKGFAILFMATMVLLIGIQCEKSVPEKQVQSQNVQDVSTVPPVPSWVKNLIAKYGGDMKRNYSMPPLLAKHQLTDSLTAVAYLKKIEKMKWVIKQDTTGVVSALNVPTCLGFGPSVYHATVQDFHSVFPAMISAFSLDITIGPNTQTDEVLGLTDVNVVIENALWGWKWTALSAFQNTPGGNGWNGCIPGEMTTTINFGLWVWTKSERMDFYFAASNYNCTIVSRWGADACG